jgi:hypothetical protein
MHPQAIAEGVDRSSKMFFAIQLAAAAILLAFIILSRYGGNNCGEKARAQVIGNIRGSPSH